MSAMEAKPSVQETIAAIMTNKDSDDDELPTDGGEASDSPEAMVFTDDDDDLFELDITLLRGFDDDDAQDQDQHGRHGVDDGGHALLANCLLPVSSVSMAVPVAASETVSSCYTFSVYSSSRRFGVGGSGSGRRKLGRAASDGGNSSWARFRLSSKGFATTMGNFQR